MSDSHLTTLKEIVSRVIVRVDQALAAGSAGVREKHHAPNVLAYRRQTLDRQLVQMDRTIHEYLIPALTRTQVDALRVRGAGARLAASVDELIASYSQVCGVVADARRREDCERLVARHRDVLRGVRDWLRQLAEAVASAEYEMLRRGVPAAIAGAMALPPKLHHLPVPIPVPGQMPRRVRTPPDPIEAQLVTLRAEVGRLRCPPRSAPQRSGTGLFDVVLGAFIGASIANWLSGDGGD